MPAIKIAAPETFEEAARLMAGAGTDASLWAGGTDLVVKLKRRQLRPRLLVDLNSIRGYAGIRKRGECVVIGAGTRIADLSRSPLLKDFGALREAAAVVATPQIRNMATVGGNLAVDTRCCFYDQNEGWRRSQGFCKKTDAGAPCRVASGSPRCFAVSSGDLPPALIALGAVVRLQGASGRREIALEKLYRDNGSEFLSLMPGELITAVILRRGRARSAYRKLRRRGSFDFSSLGVAAALEMRAGKVRNARVVLGGVASAPVYVKEAASLLEGERPSPSFIAEAARAAVRRAKPMENTDFSAAYRRLMVGVYVSRTLKRLTRS